MLWQNRNIRFGWTRDVQCWPDWCLDAAWSQRLADYDLWFVTSGRGLMRLRGDRQIDLRPGTALWMRPGGTYIAEHDPEHPLSVTSIHFVFSPSVDDHAIPPEVMCVERPSLVEAAVKRIHEYVDTARSSSAVFTGELPLAASWLRAVLMDLASDTVADLHEPKLPAMERYRRARLQPVLSALSEDPVAYRSVDEMARAAQFSRDHFGRVFREVLGQSPQSYLIDRRMDEAQRLLRSSSLSVTEIAYELGYPSIFSFTRQFRQRTSETPTQYRARQ